EPAHEDLHRSQRIVHDADAQDRVIQEENGPENERDANLGERWARPGVDEAASGRSRQLWLLSRGINGGHLSGHGAYGSAIVAATLRGALWARSRRPVAPYIADSRARTFESPVPVPEDSAKPFPESATRISRSAPSLLAVILICPPSGKGLRPCL